MATANDEFAGTGIDDTPAIDGVIDPSTLGGSGDDGFDPTIHVGRDKRNADGSFTRKRGRKSGGGSSAGRNPGKGKASPDLKAATDTLSRTLLMLHLGIAGATKTPEMALSQDEADVLANASVNVLEQFDIRPDPKVEAIVGLIIAAGTVYGPRAYLIRQRMAKENAERKSQQNFDPASAVVIDMPGVKVN